MDTRRVEKDIKRGKDFFWKKTIVASVYRFIKVKMEATVDLDFHEADG